MSVLGMLGKLIGSGKSAGKEDEGFLGSLLSGGVGSLVKGGGLVGILFTLFQILVGNAKTSSSSDEWAKVSGPVSNSFGEFFKSFGRETPEVIKSNLQLVEDRNKAAALTADDRKRIATGIVEATPPQLHAQLETMVQGQVTRLQSQPDIKPEVFATDKFGFNGNQPTRRLSLEQLDHLEHVNIAGAAQLKQAAAKQVASLASKPPECESDKLQGTINEMLVASVKGQYGPEAAAQIAKTRPPACR